MEIDLFYSGIPKANIPPLEEVEADEMPLVVGSVIDYVSREIVEHEYDITGRPPENSPESILQELLNQASRELHMRFSDSSNPSLPETYQRFSLPIQRILRMTGENSSISKRLRMRRDGITKNYERFVSHYALIHQAIFGSSQP